MSNWEGQVVLLVILNVGFTNDTGKFHVYLLDSHCSPNYIKQYFGVSEVISSFFH